MKEEKKSKKCDFSESAETISMKKIYVADTIRMSRNKKLKNSRIKNNH